MSYKLLVGISPNIQLRRRSGQIWTGFSFQVKRSKVKVKVRPDKVINTPDSLKPLLGIARNLQLQCSWGQRWTFWVLESCFLYIYAFANNRQQRHCVFWPSFWPFIRHMSINVYFPWHDIFVLTCSGGILWNLLQIFVVWVAMKSFTRSEVRGQGRDHTN